MSFRARLQVEQLGERIVPSTLSVLDVFPFLRQNPFAVLAASPPSSTPRPLAGQGQGAFIGSGGLIADTGVTATLIGTADLASTGHVSLSGSILGAGFVAVGHARGTLTFSNVAGSVTISLTGPQQAGFAALPSTYQYQIVSGTGKFLHLSDFGTLTLTMKSTPASASPPAVFPTSLGTFSITIAGGHAVVPPPKIASGIAGVAMVGPTTQLARPGIADVAPLPGAVILVTPVASVLPIARVVAGADGTFSIPLLPGTYRIVPLAPQAGQLFPRGMPQIVTVKPGAFTEIIASYDSGIR
jgi:hypothetical protein